MIYVDITELAQNPIRTGIQRVVRELLRNWRGIKPLAPCAYDHATNGLVELPRDVLRILGEETPDLRTATPETLRDMIAQARAASGVRRINPPHRQLLTPELFFDPARCRYYRERLKVDPQSAAFLIYDFIPWLHPSSISVEDASGLMHYLRLMQAARKVSFISEATRDDWRERIVRDPSLVGPVIPLGADGLELERQEWRPDRRSFVCIGSLDGRRNQDKVVKAFELLWARGMTHSLEIFGHAFDVTNPVAAAVLEAAAREPRLRHFGRASDRDVADGLRRARATIYVSTVEGYGLPPVESLHVGVPAIVTQDIPSIKRLPSMGQVRISEISPEAIASAVWSVADDKQAARLWGEARALPLTTWQNMADAMADWMGVA